MAAQAFGLQLAGERGGGGGGGPLLRYYMPSIRNITVPLKGPQQLFKHAVEFIEMQLSEP